MRALIAMVLLCSLTAATGPAVEPDKDEEEEIQEAVFRDFLMKDGSKKRTYFLLVDGEDNPSDALLARLADLKFDIRKGSRATTDRPAPRPTDQNVFDRETNEPGTLLILRPFRRADSASVDAWFIRCQGTLDASFYDCTFKKIDGRWKLAKREHTGES